jgi:hypothetical protein
VIVGKHRRHVELHAGALGKEADGLGAVLQEGVGAAGIEVRAGLVLQVGSRRPIGLRDALLRSQVGTGYPEPTAGARRRPAELRLLLDHQHLQAVVGGRDGGRHAGSPGTDHHHIEFFAVHSAQCRNLIEDRQRIRYALTIRVYRMSLSM